MYYIEENDKLNLFEKLFQIIKVEGDMIFLPLIKNKSQKHIDKLAKKTIKIIEKNSKSKKIVLSKKVQQEKIYVNYLNSYGMQVLKGNTLYKLLQVDIIEYIINEMDMNLEKIHLAILINDLAEIEYENIKKLSKKYKNINIVTNHVEKFRKMEKKLFEEYGIVITLINNKRKSLSKADIILNIDFPEEIINQYYIFERAIIISINNKVEIKKKRFNGTIINNYEIDLRDDKKNIRYFKGKYYFKDLYEVNLYEKQKYDDLRQKIRVDKVVIKELYNNSGKQIEY